MNLTIAFLLLIISLGTPITDGTDGPMPPPEHLGSVHKVKIEVVAQEQLKNDICRNMAQAFQSVPEVRLVDEDPDWTIEIVTLTLQDEEGNPTAIGLSVIVLEHGPQMNMLLTLAKAWRYVVNAGLLEKDQPLEVGMRELLIGVEGLPKSDSLTVLSQHRMCLIPVQKLGAACQDAVVNFSTRFLDTQGLAQAETSQADVSVASALSANDQ